MKKIALVFCLLCYAVLTAQDSIRITDTIAFSKSLPPVDIVQAVRADQMGTRKDVTDTTISRLYPAGTLSDLLGSGGSVALKSVGPGALATVSIRGANSMQTPVLWNGINLQNINNNTVDLSLIPVFLFDGVSVEPGSSSAAWGSGAIGGLIRVSSATRPGVCGVRLSPTYYHVRSVNEAGSFGTFMNGVQFGYGTQRWDYDLKAYRQSAVNNYTYHNLAQQGQPLDTLDHALMYQQGVMTNIAYTSPGATHAVALRSWVQETNRQIPPTMLQTVSDAVQRDYAWRTLLQYAYTKPGWTWSSNVAVIHEGLLWDGGFNQPLSNTDAWSVIGDATMIRYFGATEHWLTHRTRLTAGLTGNWAVSEVTEFLQHHEQVRAGAYVSYDKFLRKSDEFNIMLREEIIDGNAVQPVGSIWYVCNIREMLSIKGSVSHNYRVPTFNDLYWAPGGNRDLKAETGWTEEVTVAFGIKATRLSFNYSITAYNRTVTNMITWVPHASYWSPINVAEVWSRGVEHRLRCELKPVNGVRMILVLNADYVRSTYEKTDDPNDVALGKQLIYVPAWFGGGTFTVQWKGFYATYSQQYNDLRFTTRDHLEWMPAYSIGNAALGWTKQKVQARRLYELNFFIRCNNVGDVHYQSVAWRPMPGRSYTVGCTIDFALKRKTPTDTNNQN